MPPGSDTPHDALETLCIHQLHDTESVSLYDVRCRPHGKQRGPEEQPLTHQIVFPRRGVFQFESRGEKVIADATRVLFFNRDQGYHVAHPAGTGDDCTVFAFDERLLRDALELVDPRWLDASSGRGVATLAQPFRFVHGSSDEPTFWAHEHLRRVVHSPHAAQMAIDEAAVELLMAVLHSAYRERGLAAKAVRQSTRLSHHETVQRTCLLLATSFAENASLAALARAVHASPFHLARLFRREAGVTIHQYRHRLRLRAALSRIADGEADLSALALELGFSSHSHLTDAFRLAFGMPPVECRKLLAGRRFREMSRILEVSPRAGS
ncbi:MAG TPA: AraC family transcriptional regulator [Polyangiaceae bacterium]|nr:AraC family transcriptional regulator [Polyangiaceae bacterium]